MSACPLSLEPLLTVATATLDEQGVLIAANAGFLRLAGLAGTSPAGTHVDRLFMQPDFAMLVRAQPDAAGQVHQGLLTLGEYTGPTRTLRASVWREGANLQYAKAELPKVQWEEPELIQSCRFIAVIWALLLTLSTLISFFRILKPGLFPGWVYFNITLGIMLGGGIFTTLYKKYKRSQRNSIN